LYETLPFIAFLLAGADTAVFGLITAGFGAILALDIFGLSGGSM
jgi:hypothetical protein